MEQPELRHYLRFLTREVLKLAEEKGWLVPRVEARGEKMSRRIYEGSQLRTACLLDELYGDGRTTEWIGKVMSDPSGLENKPASTIGKATKELLLSLEAGDAKESARQAARWGCRILEAECCLVFIESESRVGRLRLAAAAQYQRTSDSFKQPQIDGYHYARALVSGRPPSKNQRFDAVPDSAFDRWVASFRNPVEDPLPINQPRNLFGEQLADYQPGHLGTPCYSWLSLPLHDRKGRVFGYLVAENRLSHTGAANPAVSFDPTRQHLGQAFADVLGTLLEMHPLVQSQRMMLKPVKDRVSLKAFFHEILRVALLVTRAYRGEVALYLEGDQENPQAGLRVLSGRGPGRAAGPMAGFVLPKKSFSFRTYEENKARIIPNVKKGRDSESYFECSPMTMSELVVPIRDPHSNEAIGTINLESHRLDAFDQQHVDLVQALANQGGIFAKLVKAESRIVNLFDDSVKRSDQTLQHILDRVCEVTKFSGGLIYIADFARGQLKIQAQSRSTSIEPIGLRDTLHKFDDKSVAGKAFLTGKPYFSADPLHDPDVSQKGYKAIGATGPLLALPIMFGNVVVGSMVLWNKAEPYPKEDDAARLAPYVRLGISTHQEIQSGLRREELVDSIRKLHQMVRSGLSLDETMKRSLIVLCGVVDRGRLMQFREGMSKAFCVTSAAAEKEPLDRYLGIEVDVVKSPQVKRLLDDKEGRALFVDPRVVGLDPNAGVWHRPGYLEFCNQPIFHRGELWGYIAADNVYSERALRTSIIDEALELTASLLELRLAQPKLIDPPSAN